ncbi:xylanase/chitin deacetylase, partial [Streptomyces pristinaespiralis ATCC 25486]
MPGRPGDGARPGRTGGRRGSWTPPGTAGRPSPSPSTTAPTPTTPPAFSKCCAIFHVKAVFCLWGDHVREHPELVREIVAGGHTLCNHSMHHDDLAGRSPEEIRADLERTNAEIRRAAPGVRIPYFRAPYGSWGKSPEVAAGLGMQPLGWRLAIGDWEPPGTDELVRRIQEGVTPGAVVLLHDGGGD